MSDLDRDFQVYKRKNEQLAYAPAAEGCSTYSVNALAYSFSGEEVLAKLAIGLVLSFIPILGQFVVVGYLISIAKHVQYAQRGLPRYQFGSNFIDGLVFTVAAPFIGVVAVLFCITIVGILLAPALVCSAVARYARRGNFLQLFNVFGWLRDCFAQTGQALMVFLGTAFVSLVFAVLIIFGAMLCVFPGLLAATAGMYAFAYLAGAWGRSVLPPLTPSGGQIHFAQPIESDNTLI
jgi:hypothetical protein